MRMPQRYEGRRFTDEERMLVYRRILEGKHYEEITGELNCSLRFIYRLFGARKAVPTKWRDRRSGCHSRSEKRSADSSSKTLRFVRLLAV